MARVAKQIYQNARAYTNDRRCRDEIKRNLCCFDDIHNWHRQCDERRDIMIIDLRHRLAASRCMLIIKAYKTVAGVKWLWRRGACFQWRQCCSYICDMCSVIYTSSYCTSFSNEKSSMPSIMAFIEMNGKILYKLARFCWPLIMLLAHFYITHFQDDTSPISLFHAHYINISSSGLASW